MKVESTGLLFIIAPHSVVILAYKPAINKYNIKQMKRYTFLLIRLLSTTPFEEKYWFSFWPQQNTVQVYEGSDIISENTWYDKYISSISIEWQRETNTVVGTFKTKTCRYETTCKLGQPVSSIVPLRFVSLIFSVYNWFQRNIFSSLC